MMKKILFILVATLFKVAVAQQCLPGFTTWSTQAAVDNFTTYNPGCTQITGRLTIEGTDITNLNGLQGVTSFGSLLINNNPQLSDITGLSQATEVTSDFQIYSNPSLHSLHGLESMNIIENFYLLYNPELTDLSALSGLTTITNNIVFVGLDRIKSFSGLEGLTYIAGDLSVVDMDSLATLTGLGNLNHIGGSIAFMHNKSLVSLEEIGQTDSLMSSLVIRDCDKLTNLHGMESIRYTGYGCFIEQNDGLLSLAGLENLNTVIVKLLIQENTVLTNLNGIDNISPASLQEMVITDNPLLSNCVVESVCDYLGAPGASWTIQNNAYGCDNYLQADSSCAHLSVPSFDDRDLVLIYPNPAKSTINIRIDDNLVVQRLRLWSSMGLLVNSYEGAISTIDVSTLPSGIYMAEFITNEGRFSKRLMIR